ncbi:proton pump-interactor 1 [Macadamia integrifolia]|uniref:proton pump-interactor 1 n=1 Tax=Macadamia integrifolia TaxID=60698 RepID=UPI001C529965|nr:proton pump-interactor 1 [Macadamia integrifolia]XP_042520180.1 proton pump-interactor 1 [Macadamia integrifolia]XP_042520181.1 proton pump-interactor 1 [Macadamia integrifolia]XP_042520182.1 proton pump-interactor 1 [Macadamia integrifolia]
MGVEVVGDDFTQAPVKDLINAGNGILNEEESTIHNQVAVEEPIIFGSHGTHAPVKGEGDSVLDVKNFPKDAVDEWPAPKQIHYFYFVKYRSYEDPKLKAKIEQADKEVQKKSQTRFQIFEALKAKKSDRAQVIAQLKPLGVEGKRYRVIMDEKRKEMEPLNQALGKLRGANNANRERGDRGVGICSSEAELNALVQSLHYQMQHESLTLAEEKQLLREIKQLEGTREKVIANAAMKAKIEDSLGQKEAIQDQVKLIGVDLDGVRKEQQTVRAKIKHLEDELKAIDDEISSLQVELTDVTQKRDKAYETFGELRKQRDAGNAAFYQNRTLLNNAREIAAKKDVAALEELCQTEVDKFISQFSSSKAFRDDYERRILPSLDSRQLSRDGRMRNPDEKPLISVAPTPIEPETVVKASVKRAKEDPKVFPQNDSIPIQKVQKEDDKKLRELESTTKDVDLEDKEKTPVVEKSQVPSTAKVIDEAKLKERKREEEMAKAKSALERKKKQAEKAAAKAAVRAQKEAEKKLKEREKKAKKKAVASQPEEQNEAEAADTEAVEEEKADVKDEPPVPTKSKEPKENTIRHRNRPKGQDRLPKVILKKKKSNPYWVWAAPAAAIVLLLAAALGYYYFL